MRLLYVSRTAGPHDARFIAAWQDGGVEVRAVALDPCAMDAVARLSAALEEFSPDVVQAGPLGDVAPLTAQLWHGPLLATSWGFDLMRDVEDPAVRERVSIVLQRAERTIVDNDALRAVALELGAPAKTITQFPWGVDLAFFTPRPHAPSAIILSTRNHEPLYDVGTIVDAFVAAARETPGLRLHLAGSGSLTGALHERVAAAGLADRATFLGSLHAHELRDAYRSADLYVSASLVDGSSISLLEAMACGVPVCVSRIPGNAEWVDSTSGLSFASRDSAGLASIMSSVPARRDELAALAVAARARVEERADWRRTVAGLPDLARGAIAAMEAS